MEKSEVGEKMKEEEENKLNKFLFTDVELEKKETQESFSRVKS